MLAWPFDKIDRRRKLQKCVIFSVCLFEPFQILESKTEIKPKQCPRESLAIFLFVYEISVNNISFIASAFLEL